MSKKVLLMKFLVVFELVIFLFFQNPFFLFASNKSHKYLNDDIYQSDYYNLSPLTRMPPFLGEIEEEERSDNDRHLKSQFDKWQAARKEYIDKYRAVNRPVMFPRLPFSISDYLVPWTPQRKKIDNFFQYNFVQPMYEFMSMNLNLFFKPFFNWFNELIPDGYVKIKKSTIQKIAGEDKIDEVLNLLANWITVTSDNIHLPDILKEVSFKQFSSQLKTVKDLSEDQISQIYNVFFTALETVKDSYKPVFDWDFWKQKWLPIFFRDMGISKEQLIDIVGQELIDDLIEELTSQRGYLKAVNDKYMITEKIKEMKDEYPMILSDRFLSYRTSLYKLFSKQIALPYFPGEEFLSGWSWSPRKYIDKVQRIRDTLRFLEEIDGQPPEWATTNRVIISEPSYKLRDFTQDNEFASNLDHEQTKVLVIPPNSGHLSTIADYEKNKSIVETFLKNGRPTFSMDWQASIPDNPQMISDMVSNIKDAIDHIAGKNGKVQLVGLCQGGWTAAIVAALYPENVEIMYQMGSPLNSQIGDNAITKISKFPIEIFNWFVHGFGRNNTYDGESQLVGFEIRDPYQKKVRAFWNLVDSIYDPVQRERTKQFRKWFYTLSHLSLWFLECIDTIFKDNLLYEGGLKILKKGDSKFSIVDPKKIKCPMILMEGTKDDITPPEATWSFSRVVGTSKEYIIKFPRWSVGHIGLYNAAKSQPKVAEAIHLGDELIKKQLEEMKLTVSSKTKDTISHSA